MSKLEELKKRMQEDDDFRAKFKDAKNQDEVIKIAKENGYNLENLTEKDEQDLTDDMLENIAGGKNDNVDHKRDITVRGVEDIPGYVAR